MSVGRGLHRWPWCSPGPRRPRRRQQVLGTSDSLTRPMAGTIGFDAITVALLGRATPLGTVLAGLLFGALQRRRRRDAGQRRGTPMDLTQVLQALIVLFVAAPALVRAICRIKATGERGDRRWRRDGAADAPQSTRPSADRADVVARSATAPTYAARSSCVVRLRDRGRAAAASWFALGVNDPTVTLHPRPNGRPLDDPASVLDGARHAGSRPPGGRRGSRCSPALNRVSARRRRRRWSTVAGRASRFFVGVPRLGLRRPARPFAARDRQPAPGHDPARHAADPRRAGRRACASAPASSTSRSRASSWPARSSAVVASSVVYSAAMGLLGGILAGVRDGGAARRCSRMRYQVNQVVLGVVLIALRHRPDRASCSSQIPDAPGHQGSTSTSRRSCEPIEIPGLLRDIPVIGPALFDQTLLVYLMYVSVVLVHRRCSSRPGGACGSARSASTRRPPTPSASRSTGSGGRRCSSAASSPGSAAPSSRSARPAPSTRT